jgi:hypothetical protein
MGKSVFTHIVVYILGILTVGFIQPLTIDIYNSTLGKLFLPDSKIVLSSVSNTTLKPLMKLPKDVYYEITYFKLENTGRKATNKSDQLKVTARGEILDITPKELNQRFKIDPKDKTVGFLDIGALEPEGTIEGAIHSYSKIYSDKNEAQLGFDKVGTYKFFGPNPL